MVFAIVHIVSVKIKIAFSMYMPSTMMNPQNQENALKAVSGNEAMLEPRACPSPRVPLL